LGTDDDIDMASRSHRHSPSRISEALPATIWALLKPRVMSLVVFTALSADARAGAYHPLAR
jgi:heme O synthase-like polyprenyltransferase